MQGVLGFALLGLGVWLLWDFPVGRPWLMALAVGLAAAQWHDPRAWLAALPLVLASVDLGVWSGRLLAGEQDALLAVLAGTALVAGHYGGAASQVRRRSFAPIWLLALVLGVGLARGLLPLTALDANAWNGYLTGWNALRVAKGPLWALVFWPLLAVQLSAEREATESRLTLGLVLAMLGFGVYVLWERGFFLDLVTAQNLWGLAGTWLDLSGTYRITGPFSQMHLGGEAVDGFLTLAWPFALLALLRAHRWPLTLLALAALALAAYAVMVTFTRTTYLAIGLSFLTFLAAGLVGNTRFSWGRVLMVAAYVLVTAALFLFGYHFGGTLLTLGYLAVVLGGIAAGVFAPRLASPSLLAGGLAILFAAGATLALRGMLTSKWSVIDFGPALAIVLPSILVLGVGGVGLGRTLRPNLGWREAGALLACLGLLLPALTISLSGYQIQARAATSRQDFDTRRAHWVRGLSLLSGDLSTRVFGAGLGTFPLTNLLTSPDHQEGTWHFPQGATGPYLRLVGNGSLCFGQHLSGLTPGAYRVMVRVRNPLGTPALLVVKLQPRRLLESEGWQPRTRELSFALAPADAGWHEITGRLDLGSDSIPSWYDSRGDVFVLSNQSGNDSAIDIAQVRLIDPQGREWLANGDFAAGGDRWFAYNDFQHLAWHLKSLYVAIYFDLGWLGVTAFGVLAATALWRAFGQARRGHLFGAALAAAIVGFLALGLTGTLLDVPPLMTLSLLLGSAALWRERVRRRIVKPMRTPSGSPGFPPARSAVPGS